MKQISIQKIKNLRDRHESSTSNFCDFDELQASESLEETEGSTDNTALNKYYPKDNANVLDENASDSCKPKVNPTLIKSKREAISELNKCTYKTPPIVISKLLEQLFIDYPSYDTHWPYIAQTHPPRAINRVIARMIKFHKSRGRVKNPAALFTYLIRFREKRKTSNLFTPRELHIIAQQKQKELKDKKIPF